jgi:F-type H+-transporting ATPase subunit delta
MRQETIAERYARALLDIGVDRDSLEALSVELTKVNTLFEDSEELRVLVRHPAFNVEVRKKILEELMTRLVVSPTCRNFVLLLIDQGRASLMREITHSFSDLMDLHLGRVRARVTVAQPLSGVNRTRIERSLANLTGKEVIIEEHLDDSIVAGVITEVNGQVFDGSLRTRLDSLGSQLRARL